MASYMWCMANADAAPAAPQQQQQPAAGGAGGCCVSTRTLSLGAAALHGLQAALVFGLIVRMDAHPPPQGYGLQVTRTVAVWERGGDGTAAPLGANMTVTRRVEEVGRLDVRYLVAAFFVLSSAFQTAEGLSLEAGGLAAMARLRLAEYGITASLMMVGISAECGVADACVLASVFLLTLACMGFGLMADVLSSAPCCYGEPLLAWHPLWRWVVPHLLGWLMLGGAWAPALDAYVQTQRAGVKAPAFVTAIVAAELAMFAAFGAVQTAALTARACRGSYRPVGGGVLFDGDDAAERAYVWLSLAAKTALAWLVMGPALAA